MLELVACRKQSRGGGQAESVGAAANSSPMRHPVSDDGSTEIF